jgi:WD40 repeat protein
MNEISLFQSRPLVKDRYSSLSYSKTSVHEWLKVTNQTVSRAHYHIIANNQSECYCFDISPYQCIQNPMLVEVAEMSEHNFSRQSSPKTKKRKAYNVDDVRNKILKDCDIFSHVGGSVWGLAFCPFSRFDAETNSTTHFLVVGTNDIGWCGERTADVNAPYLHGLGVGYDIPIELGKPSQYANFLQVYEVVVKYFSSQDERTGSLAMEMHLSYCIGLEESGPVWDIEWGKADGWDEDCASESDQNEKEGAEGGEDDLVLGLLGVVCGDGKCRVILIPTPSSLRTQDTASGNVESNNILSNTPLISVTHLQRWELQLAGDMVTSLAWGHISKPYIVACGLASGKIVLWDLLRCSSFTENVPDTPTPVSSDMSFRPYASSSPHWQFVDLSLYEGGMRRPERTAVRSLVFSPDCNDVFCSGGHDGVVKVTPHFILTSI